MNIFFHAERMKKERRRCFTKREKKRRIDHCNLIPIEVFDSLWLFIELMIVDRSYLLLGYQFWFIVYVYSYSISIKKMKRKENRIKIRFFFVLFFFNEINSETSHCGLFEQKFSKCWNINEVGFWSVEPFIDIDMGINFDLLRTEKKKKKIKNTKIRVYRWSKESHHSRSSFSIEAWCIV